jgi:hypothetical protein
MKSVVAMMEVRAQAYRIAKSEGLEGEAMAHRMAELEADPDSVAWDEALELATRLMFQKRGGAFTQWILDGRRKLPGLRYFAPFVTTPSNIIVAGVRKSPLGSISMAHKIMKASRTGDWSKVPYAVAEQVLAGAILAALWSNDPDDPWITGADPESRRRTREGARRTLQPQSIHAFGMDWSYARVEPFATMAGISVDGINAFKLGTVQQIPNRAFRAIVGQVKNKTYMQSFSDIFKVIDSEGGPDRFAKWAANFATSWIPNIIRTTGRARHEVYPERMIWGKDWEWAKRFGKRTLQRFELGLIPEEPSIDAWGREAPTSKAPISYPATNFLWRMVVPVRTKDRVITKGDRMMVAWNNRHPHEDEQFHWRRAEPKYTDYRKEPKHMTDKQYTQFLRLAGQSANYLVENFPGLNVEEPDDADMRVVKDAITKARAQAKEILREEWLLGKKTTPTPGRLARQIRKDWIGNLVYVKTSNPPKERKGEAADDYRMRLRNYRQRVQEAREELDAMGISRARQQFWFRQYWDAMPGRRVGTREYRRRDKAIFE